MQKRKIVFSFNAPLMISFALLSLGALGLSVLTGGKTNDLLFSVYRSPFSLFYVLRLFLHVLGHTSFSHYVGNIALILALGPIVEERWGSFRVLIMFAVTAVISGVFHLLFSTTQLMGASGIVYMLIFLASTSGTGKGEIPIALVAVCALYLTQEIGAGLFRADSVSHLTHIVGGLCGAVMGLFLHK